MTSSTLLVRRVRVILYCWDFLVKKIFIFQGQDGAAANLSTTFVVQHKEQQEKDVSTVVPFKKSLFASVYEIKVITEITLLLVPVVFVCNQGYVFICKHAGLH